MHVHHVHHSSRARVTVLSLQTSLSLTRNMNLTVAKELTVFFPKYRNFDIGNFSLTLSILPVHYGAGRMTFQNRGINSALRCE